MSGTSEKYDRAFELHKAGRTVEAIELYNAVLQKLLYLLGTANQEAGHLQLGASQLEQAVAMDPDHVASHNNLGNTLNAMGQFEQAVACYDQALALSPDYAECWYNRGNALRKLEQLEDALASYDRALALDPEHASACCNRGVTLNDLKRYEEALVAFDRAIARRPGYAGAYNNRGITHRELQRHDAAMADYAKAIALNVDYAEPYGNYGVVLASLQRLDEALQWYDRALALDPGSAKVHWNKATLLLRKGNFLDGWREFEWRLKRPDVKQQFYRFPKPLWRGETDIRGRKLLIVAEQGFGDVIQFCRFIPMVKAMGATIIVEVQQPLLPLLSTLRCDVTLVGRGEEFPEFDAYCHVMSLPHIFRATLDTIPADIPYLFSDADKVRQWRSRLGEPGAMRVGLAWFGSSGHNSDKHRSIALQTLRPLFDIPIEWHSLQLDYRPQEIEYLDRLSELQQNHEGRNDFSDTAALIECMDMVITVDTSFGHVAGAMGKPVWILLPYDMDFRWLLQREDSPWYPTARLFRQPVAGDWESVIANVRTALQQELDRATT